jgi:hypothetical protein
MPAESWQDYGSEWLDELVTSGEIDVLGELERRYKAHNVPETDIPMKMLWHIQRQILVYSNIVEQLKEGREPFEIRKRFEELDLVKSNTLPNPNGNKMMGYVMGRLERLRSLLYDFVRERGKPWIDSLSAAFGSVVGLSLETGLTPSVSLYIETGASVGIEGRQADAAHKS